MMEKGKQRVIVDDEEEPRPLRVLYFKNVLYILRRFFRYVDEHPDMSRGIVNVGRDLVLLQAFLTHRPRELDEEDGTLEEIHFFAHDAAMIVSEYDLDGMDKYTAWELQGRITFNLAVMSQRMDLIRMIIYGKDTTEALRVCFDKDIVQAHLDALLGPEPLTEDQEIKMPLQFFGLVVSSFAQFLRYVEEISPALLVVVPGMKQVHDDLALLHAFLIGRPQPFFKIHRLMNQIVCLAVKASVIISEHDLEEKMNRYKAFEKAKRLNSLFTFMSHSMDLIRIIYGKHPKAVYCFEDNLAPLDALLDYLEHFPSALNSLKLSGALRQRVLLLRAILIDRPQKLIENGTLKRLEFIARELCFTISSIHLNNMDRDVADALHDWLERNFLDPGPTDLCQLENTVEEMYALMPKPSRMYYPKTAQLNFVDLLLDNLGELLLKAKANNASLIRLLKFDILPLQRKLQELSCCLTNIAEPRNQEADVNDSIIIIANLAYEAEYVIDSFLVADIPIWYSVLWLRHILHELEEQHLLIKSGYGDAESILNSILSATLGKHRIVPILHNNTEIGDTIEKVFNEIRKQGYVCTRSLVSSNTESKRKVFLDLLRTAWIDYCYYKSDMSDAELEESLYNLLRGKWYLIILEDVQDIHALNDIKRVLPENMDCQILILFTTSSLELVVQFRHGFNQMPEHHPSTSQTDKPTIEKDVIGFTKETKRMLQQLIGGEPKKLLIISIVGMAGQGKTTLATKLFNHPLVKGYFYTRACCCISQVYEKRQLIVRTSKSSCSTF